MGCDRAPCAVFLPEEFRATKPKGQCLGLETTLRNQNQIVHNRRVSFDLHADILSIPSLFFRRCVGRKPFEESGLAHEDAIVGRADEVVIDRAGYGIEIPMVERIQPGLAQPSHLALLDGEGRCIGSERECRD